MIRNPTATMIPGSFGGVKWLFTPVLQLWAAMCFLAVVGGCGSSPGTGEKASSEKMPVTADVADISYRNWSPDARYVGREVCGTCHKDKYDSFVQSQMGRSFKKASITQSVANFNDPKPVYSDSEDLYYQPFHRGEELFVREYRLAGADTVHNRVEQIDYIVGSGQHTNSHIYETNGYLYQIPITWYVQSAKWGLPPGFQIGNSRFGRPITHQCMTCHNGNSEFFEGSENRFRTLAEGIGCERCHGPGSIHVAEKREGKIVDVSKDIDDSIVNPGKLPPERQLDVCMRCHMQGSEVFAEGSAIDSFRPGQKLEETLNVFLPRQPDSVEVFRMATHPDRLAMSACFRASWRPNSELKPMTCITCHNPHLPIELMPKDTYRNACQSCHATSSAPTCTEPTVVSGTNLSACSSCHMPQSKTQDIPNVLITDHFIRVVHDPGLLSPDEVEARRRFIRLFGTIDPKPSNHQIADGFLSYYELITNRPGMLDSAEVRLQHARTRQKEVDLTESFIHLWYLQEDYASIRRAMRSREPGTLRTAWSFFRVGEAFADDNELGIAIPYLEEAVTRAPGHLRFMARLASTYTTGGEREKAMALFREIEKMNPDYEDAVVNRGYAHLVSGDFDEAEKDFLYAISLYPDAQVTLANLASLYANTNREKMAGELVERLLKIDPTNNAYITLYRAISH